MFAFPERIYYGLTTFPEIGRVKDIKLRHINTYIGSLYVPIRYSALYGSYTQPVG